MDLIRAAMPMEFLAHSSWYVVPDEKKKNNLSIINAHRYLSTFNYVRLQAQRKNFENHATNSKKYRWPSSFPDCTSDLRQSSLIVVCASATAAIASHLGDAMNRWLRHHFSRKSRAKCLVLIGPTGTGKTSFALSLPGMVNYFKGRWSLDNWNPLARYSVYDDIGWDNFEKMNYPSKKDLLTQNGPTGVIIIEHAVFTCLHCLFSGYG